MKHFKLLAALIIMLSVVSCSGDDDKSLSTDKQIIAFTINSIEGIIDETGKTITLTLSEGTDVTQLKPVITLPEGARVLPSSEVLIDFSNPVQYTVTAQDGTTQIYTVTVSVRHVYVVGYEYLDDNTTVAKYWKDGIVTDLSDGSQDAEANSVFISGNDVYIAGADGNSAVCWKNGAILYRLDGMFGNANSVFVSGNDIYVAGTLYNDADSWETVCWKNGVVSNLSVSDNKEVYSDATSVFVSDNDVYVSGNKGTQKYGGLFSARYWKNGELTVLGTGFDASNASSICVSGNDVYIAGSYYKDNWHAIYWKNNTAVKLTDETKQSRTYSVHVSGNDVYVAGYYDSQAVYWKNGKLVSLTDGSKWATAYSVYVAGNDVYVAGREGNDNNVDVAKYWKNGVAVELSDGTKDTEITSIVVK